MNRRDSRMLKVVVSLVAASLLTGCPPKPVKVIGTHQALSFSASVTAISFYPNPNGWPAAATLTATVQTYNDYSDGTSKPGAVVSGAVVNLTTDDAGKCAALSGTTITTGASGTGTATMTALAVKKDCTVQVTATYTTSDGQTKTEVANVRVKTS